MAGRLAVAGLAAALAACGGGAASSPPPSEPGAGSAPAVVPGGAQSVFAEDDFYKPSYGQPELAQALTRERALAAAQDHRVSELEDLPPDPGAADQLRIAVTDLGVRRRFIATLERCAATGQLCPPRLDEPAWQFDPEQASAPPMTAALRFDRDSWRALAGELHGRACACRTIACVESVGVAIDQLEARPMREVQSDDDAATAVVRARECLFRLRGKILIPPAVASEPG